MKNIYSKLINKIILLKNGFVTSITKFSDSLRRDFSFHNSHTELLAIWTILFMTISGIFFLAIKSNVLVMFLLFFLAVLIMSVGTLAAVYYLHALKYRNQESLIHKIHNLLNKSFKLRTIFRFIRIPHISVFNRFTKNLRLAS